MQHSGGAVEKNGVRRGTYLVGIGGEPCADGNRVLSEFIFGAEAPIAKQPLFFGPMKR